MTRPTQHEVDWAVENLLNAATYIEKAAVLIGDVPQRFRASVWDIDDIGVIDAALADALTALADRIILDAEVPE